MSESKNWYVQRNGKAQGPFPETVVRQQILEGLILGHDLLYCEGAPGWLRALEWDAWAALTFCESRSSFTGLFKIPEDSHLTNDQWIVLVRTEGQGTIHFQRRGPLSTEDVVQQLRYGEVNSNDHVWRPGFLKWIPIFTCSEFSPEIWSQVTQRSPAIPSGVKENPMNSFDVPLVEPETKTLPFSRGTEKKPTPQSAPKASVSWKLGGLGFFVLGGLLVFGLGVYVKKVNSGSSSGIAVSAPPLPQYQELVPDDTAVAASEQSSLEAPTQARLASVENSKPKEATGLIVVEGAVSQPPDGTMAPAGPVWDFEVSALEGAPLDLVLWARSGQILKLPALTIRRKVRVPEGQVISLSPVVEKLPEGTYTVSLFSKGRLLLEKRLEFRVDEDDFHRKLSLHRKKIAFDQQAERKRLLTAVDQFQRFLGDSQSQVSRYALGEKAKQGILVGLERIESPEEKRALSEKSVLIFSNEWRDLAGLRAEVRQKIVTQVRAPANLTSAGVAKKLKALKKRALTTSFWVD